MRTAAKLGVAAACLTLAGVVGRTQPRYPTDTRCPRGTHVERVSNPTLTDATTAGATAGGSVTVTVPDVGSVAGNVSENVSRTVGVTTPGNQFDVCVPNDPGPTLSPGGLSIEGLLNDPKALDQAIKRAEEALADAKRKYGLAMLALTDCQNAHPTASNPPPHRGNPGGAGFYTRKPQKPSPCADQEAALQAALAEFNRAAEFLKTLQDMKANPNKYKDPRFQ